MHFLVYEITKMRTSQRICTSAVRSRQNQGFNQEDRAASLPDSLKLTSSLSVSGSKGREGGRPPWEGKEFLFHSRRVVSTPAGLFPLQRSFFRVQTTLIFDRLDEITVSLIFKFILSSYWEKVWSSRTLEWKHPFLEINPSE